VYGGVLQDTVSRFLSGNGCVAFMKTTKWFIKTLTFGFNNKLVPNTTPKLASRQIFPIYEFFYITNILINQLYNRKRLNYISNIMIY
jgi:hypothetical protein